MALAAQASAEMFENHDLSFAGRTVTEAMKACSYNEGSIALAQYGPYWRMLRRVCTTELSTNRCLNKTIAVWSKFVDNKVRWIKAEARQAGSVDVGHFVFTSLQFDWKSYVIVRPVGSTIQRRG